VGLGECGFKNVAHTRYAGRKIGIRDAHGLASRRGRCVSEIVRALHTRLLATEKGSKIFDKMPVKHRVVHVPMRLREVTADPIAFVVRSNENASLP
jgi:hypothetical protein